jgi:hypothetical protein
MPCCGENRLRPHCTPRTQICLIEYPRGALRVFRSVEIRWVGARTACRRVFASGLGTKLLAHRISPRCGSKEVRAHDPPESGVPTVVFANDDWKGQWDDGDDRCRSS